MGDELLAAPARVDRHAQRHVDRAGDLRERPDRGRRVDREPDRRALLAQQPRGVGDVRRGLRVKGDRVGAGLDEVRDVPLGALDHQVHVEQRLGALRLLAQRGDDERPDGDRRHEVTVHHVDVDHPRAGVEHLLDLLSEAGEVGREDRRRHVHARERLGDGAVHIGCNMLSPQLLHFTIAVDDMRTIVECSPQFGHTDESSKRCRQ